MSHNQVLDDAPWLAPDAIQQIELFLEGRVTPRVFEWGAGGSTLFFAARAAQVISVEHDSAWYKKAFEGLNEREVQNVTLFYLIEMLDYVFQIQRANYKFDLVVVDGVQRNACALMALDMVNTGGWLVLDNTERETEYAEALSLLKDWERKDYQGDGFVTSIFVKP